MYLTEVRRMLTGMAQTTLLPCHDSTSGQMTKPVACIRMAPRSKIIFSARCDSRLWRDSSPKTPEMMSGD